MIYENLYISSGTFGNVPCLEFVETLVEEGFNRFEFTAGAGWDESMAPTLKYKLDQNVRYLLHNYFPKPENAFVLNLASNNSFVLENSINLCKRAIQLAASLKAQIYTMHAGFCFHANPEDLGKDQSHLEEIPREQALEIFLQSMRTLAEFASPLGVSLAFENNVVTHENRKGNRYLGVTQDEITFLCETLSNHNIGYLLDVAHLKVSARTLGFCPENFIRHTAHFLSAVHLSDNDGSSDSNQCLHKDSWFWNSLKAHVPTSIPWVLEVYKLDIEGIKQQVELVKEMVSN